MEINIMPELPEVETLCRQLHKKIAGNKILETEIYDSKLAHMESLKGRTVQTVSRMGKTIVVMLDNGISVLIHLRMTGRLLWQKKKERPAHSRWRMSFAEGNVFLIDPRRFATIKILKTMANGIDNDIMHRFDQQAFIAKYGKRKTKVKNLMMDQKVVSGIGNIYACEILYQSAIHPERSASALKNNDWQKIFGNANNILEAAIKKRGTSISDWRDLYGRKGENQHELKVYGREGKKCEKCGSTIRRMKQGGRSTFYCEQCQKKRTN
jgi:formamidopyrimidine-DNA glycosylase